MRALMLLIWAVLAAMPAHAVTVTFCVKYHVNYADSGNGEDYISTNADQEARGLHAELRTMSNTLVWQGYLDEDGSTPGCHAATITSGTLYKMTVTSYIYLKSNHIEIFEDDTLPTNYQEQVF